ncbi:MAG: amino acid permease, partial [Acidimicrobiales bacterium]
GIFLTTADIARVLPHGGMILLVWLVGGLLSLAGALTYGELGAMLPRAGGMYHFLKEAYGPLPGFLYGWACFLVIMSGGIAAIAVGFGVYLGYFLPFFSTENVLLSVPLGGWTWNVYGAQLAAALAILLLTVINWLGLRQGAWTQNLLTVLKIGAVVVFALIGFLVPAKASANLAATLPPGNLLAAFGVAMIAALWTYDGWYGLTFSAGELRRPERDLPRGLLLGTAAVVAMSLLLNFIYLRALPVEAMGETARIGEAAAGALFGAAGSRWLSAAVLVSTFGCLSSTILYSSRIYQPMAEDGVFVRRAAAIHPRYRTPGWSLWLQSLWAVLLTLSGSYEQLYTYVTFAAVFFHVLTGAALFVLRKKRPELLESLDPTAYGFTVWDLDRVFPAAMLGKSELTLREILAVLRRAYCRR